MNTFLRTSLAMEPHMGMIATDMRRRFPSVVRQATGQDASQRGEPAGREAM